jgi:hypothetical protein
VILPPSTTQFCSGKQISSVNVYGQNGGANRDSIPYNIEDDLCGSSSGKALRTALPQHIECRALLHKLLRSML